jgi:hypothetical protein
MINNEGADSAEVIVRPTTDGWRVEVPTSKGVSVGFARSMINAVNLAKLIAPNAEIRILPAEGIPDDNRNSRTKRA